MITFREEDHTYWDNDIEYPSVTTILQKEGLIDTRWFDDWSRERGIYVHKAIELYNKGELLEKDLDEHLAPYLDAWRRLRANSQIEIIESEKMVYSEIWHYAGTLDILCKINGEESIIDLKSGAVDAATPLQLAGYAMAYHANYYSIKRYGLSLKDGKATIKEFTNFDDFNIWKSIVAIHQYKLKHNLIKEKYHANGNSE